MIENKQNASVGRIVVPGTGNTINFWDRRLLEVLKKKFRFRDWMGVRLFDAYGRLINKEPMLPPNVGGTIEFKRK